MNEEISHITNKGKTVKNELENDDSGSLQALYSVYKIRSIIFPYLIVNLFKQRYISAAKSYKHLIKLISYKNDGLSFFRKYYAQSL